MKYTGKTGEYFEVENINKNNCDIVKKSGNSELSLLWFESDGNKFKVDAIDYTFQKNDIICFTEFHKVEIQSIEKAKLLRWNRPFYCVLDHDSEVGCKGILYYGSSTLPVINLNLQEEQTLMTVWKMLEQEMGSYDNLQQEMLQMMLKRILILCTRIYKNQLHYRSNDNISIDIIREYNFLVEQHYKQKHTVVDYAKMLNKSPKTLSNLFKKIGKKTPTQFIQERKMLEARRLLFYTDRSVSEIGYEIGFEDVQSFSRFFKKQEGKSPALFRNQA